jgi:prefoldin subunit 5
MLKEFLKKISEWTLQKEEELAKECKIPVEKIDEQIEVLNEKKAEIEKNLEEINNLIKRLEKIKNIELLKCGANK